MKITVNDERAPVAPASEPATWAERQPLGALVQHDGHLVPVVGHPTDAAVEVLVGAEWVTLTGDQLAAVQLMGLSADAYAQRVSRTARRMARVHDFCDVAERTIEELNRTPAEADNEVIHVTVTVTERFALRRRRRAAQRDVLRELRYNFEYQPSRFYGFDRVDRELTGAVIELVDAPPAT